VAATGQDESLCAADLWESLSWFAMRKQANDGFCRRLILENLFLDCQDKMRK
jgi:hypothetical protein